MLPDSLHDASVDNHGYTFANKQELYRELRVPLAKTDTAIYQPYTTHCLFHIVHMRWVHISGPTREVLAL